MKIVDKGFLYGIWFKTTSFHTFFIYPLPSGNLGAVKERNMRKKYFKQLFATMVMLFFNIIAIAHYFEVNGIFYNIIGENEVSVTFQGEKFR